MATDKQNNAWPTPKFNFSVEIAGETSTFQEVSGLALETQPIEFRNGDSKIFPPVKMPGLQKVGTVTLKKGMFTKDSAFWEWYSKIQMNSIARANVIIKLLDENGGSTMTWTLQNAWPVKVIAPDLNSEGNEVAVESVEIAFETMVIANS